MNRRVVVTGLGTLAPNGHTTEEFWSACLAGRSGIERITAFDTTGFAVQAAGEIRGFRPQDFVRNRKALKIMGRNIQFGVAASAMAMEDAGFAAEGPSPERFGVVMGTGIVPTDVEEVSEAILASLDERGEFDLQRFGETGQKVLFPLWLLKHLPNMVSGHLSIIHGAEGPNNTVVTGCIAATQAIGDALQIIRRGEADVMLAGGTDTRIDPISLIAYDQMGTISTSSRPPAEACRPFESSRDGFVLGEGAACLVLESESHARQRRATIHAEVAGYATTFAPYGGTEEAAGRAAAQTMQTALRDAGIPADAIDYVSAHGIATPHSDRMETLAAKIVFGARASVVPMSSIKSMIGHLVGASGAVDAVASTLALRDGVVPPTINLDLADPQCDMDYVAHTARELHVGAVLSNAFGFGGQNAALVMREYEH